MWDARAWAAVVATSVLLAACGGSASESPWPVEPLDTDPGPAGEQLTKGNVVDTRKLPDNYSKSKGAEDDSESEEGEEPSEESEGGGGAAP